MHVSSFQLVECLSEIFCATMLIVQNVCMDLGGFIRKKGDCEATGCVAFMRNFTIQQVALEKIPTKIMHEQQQLKLVKRQILLLLIMGIPSNLVYRRTQPRKLKIQNQFRFDT